MMAQNAFSTPIKSNFTFGAPATTGGSGGFNFGTPNPTGNLFSTETPKATNAFGTPQPNPNTFSFGAQATTNPVQTTTPTFTFQPTTSPGLTFQPNQSTGFPFGGSTQTAIGTQPTSTNQQVLSNSSGDRCIRALDQIRESYDETNRSYKFKYMLYNAVENPRDPKWAPRADYDQVLLTNAIENNPDPSRLVPVQALGLPDLQKRVEGQQKLIIAHATALREMMDTVNSTREQLNTSVPQMLKTIQSNHLRLTESLVGLTGKIELLEAGDRSLGMDELVFRTKLEDIHSTINRPKVQGRLQELRAFVDMSDSSYSDDLQLSEDPKAVQELNECIRSQKEGIEQLITMIQKDMKDMDKISQFMQNQ